MSALPLINYMLINRILIVIFIFVNIKLFHYFVSSDAQYSPFSLLQSLFLRSNQARAYHRP